MSGMDMLRALLEPDAELLAGDREEWNLAAILQQLLDRTGCGEPDPAPWQMANDGWRDENGDPIPNGETWGAAFSAFSEDVAPLLGITPGEVFEFVKLIPIEDVWCFESAHFWTFAAEAVAKAMRLPTDPEFPLFDPTVH